MSFTILTLPRSSFTSACMLQEAVILWIYLSVSPFFGISSFLCELSSFIDLRKIAGSQFIQHFPVQSIRVKSCVHAGDEIESDLENKSTYMLTVFVRFTNFFLFQDQQPGKKFCILLRDHSLLFRQSLAFCVIFPSPQTIQNMETFIVKTNERISVIHNKMVFHIIYIILFIYVSTCTQYLVFTLFVWSCYMYIINLISFYHLFSLVSIPAYSDHLMPYPLKSDLSPYFCNLPFIWLFICNLNFRRVSFFFWHIINNNIPSDSS